MLLFLLMLEMSMFKPELFRCSTPSNFEFWADSKNSAADCRFCDFIPLIFYPLILSSCVSDELRFRLCLLARADLCFWSSVVNGEEFFCSSSLPFFKWC